jgi:hypothetical protein
MKRTTKFLPVGLAVIAVFGLMATGALPASAAQKKIWMGTASSISGTDVSLAANNGSNYTVDASRAKILRKFGTAVALSDMRTGDKLRVQGVLESDNATINASTIRDMSLQSHNGAFSGKIASVGANSFTINTASRGQQTINTSASTVFKLDGQAAQFSDLAPDLNVNVKGVWDRTNSVISASRVDIIKNKTFKATGAISAINGMMITVHSNKGTDYQVGVANAKITKKGGGLISAADLKTGDRVAVSGKLLVNSTSVTASKVRDLSR